MANGNGDEKKKQKKTGTLMSTSENPRAGSNSSKARMQQMVGKVMKSDSDFKLARATDAKGNTVSFKVIPTGKKDADGFSINKNVFISNTEYDRLTKQNKK